MLLLKVFISKWSNFNCIWGKKKNLEERLKRLENCQTEGSQGLAQGALDQACVSCSASCILSRAVVPALMNDFIACNRITHRISCHQYVLTGICRWPLSKMFLCRGTLQSSEEGYSAGAVSVCHLLALVPRPFANIFLCVFGFIYMKLNTAFRHRHLAVEQELGLPLCLFLESLEFSRHHWGH